MSGTTHGTTHLQVSTTIDSAGSAADLARSGVQARLAACGQVAGPITSTYWWKDAVETATEWLITFKTTADRCPALVEHVRAAHSYEVPEIIVTPITGGHAAYLDWITAQTQQ